MSKDRVYDSFLSQVPDLDCVIVASSRNLVPIWEETDRDYLADVGWELKDVLPAAQVPDKSSAVQIASTE